MQWPVKIYKFYGVKMLRPDRKAPYTTWDYSRYTRTHQWTPPIWAPHATVRGYHVYIFQGLGLKFPVEDQYKGDLLYLAECVIPRVLDPVNVTHGLIAACTSIRLIKRLTPDDHVKLNFDKRYLCGLVDAWYSGHHVTRLRFKYKGEFHDVPDPYDLPDVLRVASEEVANQ